MAQTSKADNSYLVDKIKLRIEHLPQSDKITVLDCFAGFGLIWKAIEKQTSKDVMVLPIDVRKAQIGFRLPGNNRDFLSTLDLSRFDVIDLDAYGVPYEQLKTIFRRGYRGNVFVTFIQSIMNQMPYGLLVDIGFSEAMIKKTPTLFGKRGWWYFKQWLALNGVTEIYHRSHHSKHYLYFNCSGARATDYDNQPEDISANPS